MATPEACILIRDKPHYRREAFVQGAINAGYVVTKEPKPHKDNILVIWNRYGVNHNYALQYEKAGGKVYVVENGLLGNEFNGGIYYTVSLNQHNVGNTVRFKHWHYPLKPYREGSEVIVLPQRGIGQEGVKMPRDWLDRTYAYLKRKGVKYRVREHPGVKPCVPLDDDLANAKCVVTWGSGAALKALVMGVPVVSDFKQWIGASASTYLYDCDFDGNLFKCRGKVLNLIASSIFTLDEIERGVCYV